MDSHYQLIAVFLLGCTIANGQDAVVPLADRITATKPEPAQREMKSVMVRISQRKPSWRVCYSGDKLKVIPFFGSGETWTQFDVIECPTLVEAKEQVAVLHLKLTVEQEAAIDELTPIPAIKEDSEHIGP